MSERLPRSGRDQRRRTLGRNFLVDDHLVARLTAAAHHLDLADRIRVIPTTVERLRLPRVPYRVVANPPFGRTTAVLSTLLDDPSAGPTRADLEQGVARKHATTPPRALRTAAWAPWWHFEIGLSVPRRAFRPRPGVDAAVLDHQSRLTSARITS